MERSALKTRLHRPPRGYRQTRGRPTPGEEPMPSPLFYYIRMPIDVCDGAFATPTSFVDFQAKSTSLGNRSISLTNIVTCHICTSVRPLRKAGIAVKRIP